MSDETGVNSILVLVFMGILATYSFFGVMVEHYKVNITNKIG